MNPMQIQNLENQQTLGVNGPDARRMRKAIFRRTIDYNAAVINYLGDRIWQRSARMQPVLQPDYLYNYRMYPPCEYLDNPMNCVTGKPVRTSTNKNKCPIYCVCWTPEGRRLITGAYSGEFTLWNGLTFNFETILQAHESQIRCMKWSHNDEWLLTADHAGYVKYWQANMNNVEMYQAHKEPIRGVSFSPFDTKFVTCSDDSTVRIWDFLRCTEERVLRGHGSDVRSVAWHPQKSLIISGSKDAQQPIKLWEPKTGESIATLYVHKNTCTDVAWNQNGNWFLTASRDHLIKLFDLRYMKTELQTFRGHKRDVMRVAWHPCNEGLFASGSADGAILFWSAGTDTELGTIDDAHESMIWSLAWHPLGHILVSGANDFATKFWTRNRPGDILKDIIGTGSAVNALPAVSSDDVGSFLPQSTSTTTKSVGDRVTDEVGGSLARALADAAGRLPIFDSTSEQQDNEEGIEEEDDRPRTVEIPGLNEGSYEVFGIDEEGGDDGEGDGEDDEEDKKRLAATAAFRQMQGGGCSISKEFMAHWSSSRANNIVLSAVAAAANTSESLAATEDQMGRNGDENTIGEEGGNGKLPIVDARSVSTPLFTSDMSINPNAAAQAAKVKQMAEEDNRQGIHKGGRKLDSAAREEDMLAFAKSLMPPEQPRPPPPQHLPSQQPPQRFPRPHMPPSMIRPPPDSRMQHPHFRDGPPRFPPGPPMAGSRPPMSGPPGPMMREQDWNGFQGPPLPPNQMPQHPGHPWDHRPRFRPPMGSPDQWQGGPPRFRGDFGPFPPPPKRPAMGGPRMGGLRPPDQWGWQ